MFSEPENPEDQIRKIIGRCFKHEVNSTNIRLAIQEALRKKDELRDNSLTNNLILNILEKEALAKSSSFDDMSYGGSLQTLALIRSEINDLRREYGGK